MDELTCISCGAYIKVGGGNVKFPCPECDSVIVRCQRCRKLGRKYTCECGFSGP
jgi:hypothetical protein